MAQNKLKHMNQNNLKISLLLLSTCNTTQVVETNSLTAPLLEKLALKEIAAIRVANFLDPSYCQQLSHKLLGYKGRTYYEVAPQIGKIGTPFFESRTDETLRQQYYQNQAIHRQALEMACQGLPLPNDLLFQTLHQQLANGIDIEKIDGLPLSLGIFRILEEGSTLRPHQDMLKMDAPNAKSPKKILGQLAVNMYLQVPEIGGELIYWKESYSPAAYLANQLPGTVDLDIQKLPPPLGILSPKVGDLVLINSNCIHAVNQVKKGCRITNGGFLGYYGNNRPWSIWS